MNLTIIGKILLCLLITRGLREVSICLGDRRADVASRSNFQEKLLPKRTIARPTRQLYFQFLAFILVVLFFIGINFFGSYSIFGYFFPRFEIIIIRV